MTRYYSETEVVAQIQGMTVARLRAFVAADCVAPVEQDGRLGFREADVARLQLLEELVDDFELDPDAAAIVVSLIDQIHGLRAELKGLLDALEDLPPDLRATVKMRITQIRGGGPR